jgi:hypothetical protein
MREDWTRGIRWFGWGVAALLVVQLSALWLRQDPLSELVLTDREQVLSGPVSGVSSNPVTNANPATNTDAAAPSNPTMNPEMGMPGMPGMMPGMMRGRARVVLPLAVQARLDRITQSEILGPVMRPLPMGLLGIAGEDAFLRAPNGQAGLMRVGDELGGIRLLQIGTNRVLIEHENQKKELTLYSGFGGESLLSGEPQPSVGERPVMVGQ